MLKSGRPRASFSTVNRWTTSILRGLDIVGSQSGGPTDVAVRFMSKYLSKSATKRLPLTTKRARKGFYKGNGATKEGHWVKGKYQMDKDKMLELIVPDLTGFRVSC